MGKYSGNRRTYWCMDCNLFPVPGPNQQCDECSGVELDWDNHVAPLLSKPLVDHWPAPRRDYRPPAPVKLIPRSINEVTYHPRVTS